ncbi:MAG: hypothetical protein CW338_01865 [Clostridiales bacterium]|nr:hypothetical protein [Clostridiales bacterium]
MLTKIKYFFSSTRFRVTVAFLLIAGLAILVIASTQIGTVGDYLYQEHISSYKLLMGRLSEQTAEVLNREEDPESLIRETADALEGTILLLDDDGRVLCRSGGDLPEDDGEENTAGQLITMPDEARSVLNGQRYAFGVHDANTGEKQETTQLVYFFRNTSRWVNFYAQNVKLGEDENGILLLTTDVSVMMRDLYKLQKQLLIIYAVICFVVLVVSLFFAHIITKPIRKLTGTIQNMEKGDFSVRVPVTGSGEMKQLALAFNSMSEKIESLDNSRNQFVSNASHELKTPLATMKILIENLIYEPEMEKKLRIEFLTDIDREIDRLSAIVSDLLTLVSMDSHSIRLNRESLSLAAIVKETEHRLQPIVEKRKQTMQLSLSDSCDMYADKSKLTQVVYNIMENAVKYTQEGGTVKVTLQRSGRDAKLVVSDNGPGIPKENLPYIFDRFYRVDKARSRESGGTGLGLSIVHQLVILHSGTIRVESEPGTGTSFIVELPLHQG